MRAPLANRAGSLVDQLGDLRIGGARSASPACPESPASPEPDRRSKRSAAARSLVPLAALLLGVTLTGCDGIAGGPGPVSDGGGRPDGGAALPDGGGLPDAGYPAAPTVEITSGPPPLAATATAQLEFAGGPSVVRFECQLDTQAAEPCTSPKAYQALAAGPHQFQVTAFNSRDAGASALHPWTVDLAGPPVELFASPAATTTATNPRFEFRSTDPSGVAEFHCQLDGQGFTACQSPRSYSALSLASHTFEVKARDGAGNWGSPAAHPWQIVLSPASGYDQSFVTSSTTITGVNGWYPQVSADTKYLLSGFGEIWGIDLTTGAKQLLMARGYYPQWIRPGVGSFIREDNANGSLSTRFEVPASTWVPAAQPGDPTLVSSSIYRAADGHWASWLAIAFRITYDGVVLVPSGAGGALQISEGDLAHAIMTNGQYWGVRHFVNGVATHDYPVKTPQEAHELALCRGYIAYGGYGPIHGITPAGVDVDLTIAPWKWEARPQLFFIGGKPWLATTSFNGPANRGYIFVRPWGESAAIVLEDGDAASLHAVELNGVITLAMNDPTGRLVVRKFSIDAPRVAIRP